MKNRKSLMALDQLLGILLSAMALIMLFIYFVAPILLYTPTNLVIAKSNANSIKNFVDYSSTGEYGSFKSCFTMLRIHHLENFQHSDSDKDNYFYVIDNSYVYVLPFGSWELFEKKNDVSGLYVFRTKKFEKNPLNLVKDDTEQGSFFSGDLAVEFLPFIGPEFSFGKTSDSLSIGNPAKYLVLKPILTKDSRLGEAGKILDEKYSQNRLEGIVVLEGKNEVVDGTALAFRNSDKKLFITNGLISDAIINGGNLCSVQKMYKRDLNEYYLQKDANGKYINLRDIPYNEKKLVYKFKLEDGTFSSYVFEWAGKGFCKFDGGDCDKSTMCDDCKILYDKIIDSDDPYNFERHVEIFFPMIEKGSGTGMMSVVDLKDGEFDEMKIEVRFKDAFREYIDSGSGESINVYKIRKDLKKGYVFDIAGLWGANNRLFNGVEKAYSNEVMYHDGQAFFYVSGNADNAKYYSFKHDYLKRKTGNGRDLEFYMNNQKLEYVDRIEGDAYGISIPFIGDSDDKFFYWIKVPIEGKTYDVILSPNQVGRILTI